MNLAKRIFDAVLPIILLEAKSERRKLNPWFSIKAKGPPPKAERAQGVGNEQ